ncbi:ABC transporter substrate-binding protein [Candidatus Electronema sp. JM]|uniref:ABC transporter substrate-binding protein n=1 Tax=Candidatus Electronema sp. JM TaxID=3401571 RepID=UPI003AA995C7
MNKKVSAIIAAAFLLFFAVTAQAEPTELNYRLKWLFNTSVAGDIYADSGGFFAKAGLKVNVKEGSPEKNAISELELGRADFGCASADQVIRALEKGAKLVVLAQIFQISPMQWIYRANQPEIKTLADLKGRSIGITFGGNDETVMNTLLAQAGIAKKDVKLTGVRFDFSPFLTGKVDVWPVYRNTQGVLLQDKMAQAGEQVRFLDPAKFGVNFVANSVITSKKMLHDQPQLVEKFLAALLQGWEAAMNPANEASVLAAVKHLEKDGQDDIMRKQLAVTRELVQPAPSSKIGALDIPAWQQTEAIMLREKQIEKAVGVKKKLVVRK